MTKKYLLFASQAYAPSGGWEDYKWESDNINELKDIFVVNCMEDNYKWNSCHIVDLENKKIIIKAWTDREWITDQKGRQREGDLKIVWVTEDLDEFRTRCQCEEPDVR